MAILRSRDDALVTLGVFMVAALLMISPENCAGDDNCSTVPNLRNKVVYKNCSVLSELNATLYWTHNSADSSFSFALAATMPNLTGWLGFGLNLKGTGMSGAQAVIALGSGSNGSVTAKPFMLQSYQNITQESLTDIGVTGLGAETTNVSVMILYANLSIPKTTPAMTKLNYIWQVGPAVTAQGMPLKHAFEKENLDAKGTLELTTTTNGTSGGGGGSGNGTSSRAGESMRIRRNGASFGLLALLFGNFILGFFY